MIRLLRMGFIIVGLCVLCCVALFAANPSTPAGGVALDTTSHTYVLFLDMQEVESLKNVELVVNKAEKVAGNRFRIRRLSTRSICQSPRQWSEPAATVR